MQLGLVRATCRAPTSTPLGPALSAGSDAATAQPPASTGVPTLGRDSAGSLELSGVSREQASAPSPPRGSPHPASQALWQAPVTQSPTPPFPALWLQGGGATADADLASAVCPPQAPAGLSQKTSASLWSQSPEVAPSGQGGWGGAGGRLAAHQLESQGPQRGVCLGPRQKSPRERLCWSTSSAGSHTGGTLGPTCTSRSTALPAGSADSAPTCMSCPPFTPPSAAQARRAAGGVPTLLSPAPVPGQSPQTRQGRVTRGGGRGLRAGSASYGLKSPRKTERNRGNPAWKGRAHSGKAWLLARCCSKPANCSCHP